MTNGIVLVGPDKIVESRAKSLNLPVTVNAAMPLAYDKTLFVVPGTRVPWDLVPAGWHFLERWDAAVPLWRYGVTAADVGTKEERKRTAAVCRDLRVLLHSVELLFVRDNELGRGLMEAYRRALADISERRLAFLQAFYLVKPRLCVLPTSWMAEVQAREKQDLAARRGKQVGAPTRPLTRVEIAPGKWIKCYAGDEARVLAQFRQQNRGRRGK